MRLILCSSALLAILASAPRALAQDVDPVVARVTIGAPRNYVVASRGLQLLARAINGDGALVAGRTFQWRTSDPTRATIDDAGMLRGLAPGPVDVTVADADTGVSNQRRFYVYPGRIMITGGSLTVPAGSTLQLAAQVLDADAKPIPNVPIQWLTTKLSVVTIASGGLLTGVAEGQATVEAGLDMGPAYARFTAFATVTVLRRPDFRLRSMISSAVTSSVSMLAPTRISAAGSYVAGVTSLSNGGQGLLLWQNGPLQMIFASGSVLNNKVVTRIDGVSVNSRGDVLALAWTQAEWCNQLLILFTAASKWRPTVLDDSSNCVYFSPPPASLDSQAGIVFRTGQALYYRKPDGARQAILTIGDVPAGSAAITNITNWGFSRFGKVLIEATDSSFRSVYFAWDGAKLQKLFAVGETIENNVTQWARLPVEVGPGEYITRAGGGNWSSISRLKDGVWTLVARNGRDNINWIHDNFDATDGDIFFWADYASDGAPKTTLLRNKGTTTSIVATYSNWSEVNQINALGSGSVLALGVLGGATPRAVRFTGSSPETILGLALPVDSKAPAALSQLSVPKGVNLSSSILRTSGDTLLRSSTSGVTVLLKPGDALPVGALATMGGLATNRLGDAAFTAQHGAKQALYTYQNGRVQAMADADDQIPGIAQITGFPLWSDSQIAMNNRGHIAVRTNTTTGDIICLYTQNASTAKMVARFNAAIPGNGAILVGLQQIAIDESDRVAFIGNLNTGRAGLFIWDQGAVTEVLETGQADLTGRTYTGLNGLQSAGSRFYLRASTPGLTENLVIEGTTPKLLVIDGYATTFGTVVSYFFGPEMAANSRGDFVFPAITTSGAALIVKRAGSDALVAISNQRGPDQEWFLQIFSAGISEQGEIIFSALVYTDGSLRLALYEAIPSPN